jgi:hypothetical protein
MSDLKTNSGGCAKLLIWGNDEIEAINFLTTIFAKIAPEIRVVETPGSS